MNYDSSNIDDAHLGRRSTANYTYGYATRAKHAYGDRQYYTSNPPTEEDLVLATGPGNPPAVRVLTGGSVRFGSRPGQKPDPLCLGGFVTRTGHRTAGIWPGWNRTAVPNIRFLLLWLQLSI
jgi:hypothetical protein